MRFGLRSLIVAASLSTAAHAADMGVEGTARLILLAEKNVPDSRGWAADMLDVMREHKLEQSRENVCAGIAVIDQESSFQENPAVPGLGKIAEAALRAKFNAIPLGGLIAVHYLETSPRPDDSYMMRIRNAKTERDLDLVFRSFVANASNSTSLGTLVNSGLFNKQIESRNHIETAGSMQVSVKFAIENANKKRWLPMQLSDDYAVRDELYTRRGGMYYGIQQLLGYESGYDKKIYRFADYNAGRYSSRNAAFQKIIAEMSGGILMLDGDLLAYESGAIRGKPGSTEMAIRKIAASAKLDLSDAQIRRDLKREKNDDFIDTRTFKRLRNAYAQKTGRAPPFAIVPEIRLSSPKIKRAMTTKSYAETVNRRYQSCMAARP